MTQADSQERFITKLTGAQDALYSYILSLVAREDLAWDVLQETNLVLWRKAKEYDESKSFIAWACGVSRFQVKAWRRDAQRSRLIFNAELLSKLEVEAERYAVNDTFDELVRECLNALPEEQRELVIERYLPGSSLKAMSLKLGRSINGLAVSLFRIRQTLAECLERKL